MTMIDDMLRAKLVNIAQSFDRSLNAASPCCGRLLFPHRADCHFMLGAELPVFKSCF
jgi:hypothetical protein